MAWIPSAWRRAINTRLIELGIIEQGDSPTGTDATALTGKAATGSYLLAAKPSINDTLVFNGVTFTFKAASGGAAEITIGATLATAIANALTILNDSVHASVTPATYSSSAAGKIDVTHDTKGTVGNAYTLGTVTGGNVTRSAATLEGGTDGKADGTAGVKVYRALVTLGDPPTGTPDENSLGGAVTLSKESTGLYGFTKTGGFPGNTYCHAELLYNNDPATSAALLQMSKVDANSCFVAVFDKEGAPAEYSNIVQVMIWTYPA